MGKVRVYLILYFADIWDVVVFVYCNLHVCMLIEAHATMFMLCGTYAMPYAVVCNYCDHLHMFGYFLFVSMQVSFLCWIIFVFISVSVYLQREASLGCPCESRITGLVSKSHTEPQSP